MTCHEIYAYWEKLCGAARSPMRNRIEPAALRYALPDLFMLEASQDGDLVFRLAGTRLCALFGRELRGRSFHELWAGGRTSSPMDIVQGVVLYESPVLMNLMGFFKEGDARRFDMLLLPVRSSEEQCDRLMGALVPAAGAEMEIASAQTLQCLFMDRSRPLKRTSSHTPPAAAGREGGGPEQRRPIPPRFRVDG